jgi:hypothetical protein
MMNKKAKITIVLEYDLESLRFMTGREIPEDDFAEEVEEYAFHDLQDLLRSNGVFDFSEVEFTDVE